MAAAVWTLNVGFGSAGRTTEWPNNLIYLNKNRFEAAARLIARAGSGGAAGRFDVVLATPGARTTICLIQPPRNAFWRHRGEASRCALPDCPETPAIWLKTGLFQYFKPNAGDAAFTISPTPPPT